jgi:single-strand DNA-binding protein
MNKVILKGRLTADPEIKTTQNGNSVCKFTVAVNRKFNKDITDFINCEAWRQTAEFISKYFSKGKEIALIGELHIDKYDKNGETKYITKIQVDEVEFCGNKGNNVETAKPQENTDVLEAVDDSDDLPF